MKQILSISFPPQFPDYLIYSDGRVYSIRSEKFLKPRDNGAGYLQVVLYGKEYLLHRLVAIEFLGPNPNLEVHHKDHNPYNCDVSNLQWVTHKENVAL